MRSQCNDQGFTLIELMLAVVIFGIVMQVIVCFYLLGSKMVKTGEMQSDFQQEVRIAAKYITNQVRYARELSILEDDEVVPDPVVDDWNYVFVTDDGSVKYRDKSRTSSITSDLSANCSFRLQFEKDLISDGILHFNIGVNSGGKQYQIESDVLVLNLPEDTAINGTQTGAAIQYR